MSIILEFLPIFGLGMGWVIGKQIDPTQTTYFLAYGAIAGTLLQFAIYKLRKEKIKKMVLLTGAIFIIFGAATIIFKNDLFLYLKPTVVSWLFAIGFFVYPFIKNETVLESMIGDQFKMTKKNWSILNYAWIIFNLLLGAINLYIALGVYTGDMPEDVWVKFKLWGFTSMTLVFIIAQTIFLFKFGEMIEESKDKEEM